MRVVTLLNHPMHLKPFWSSLDAPHGPQPSRAPLLSPKSAQVRAKPQKEKENLFPAPAQGEKVWGANYRPVHQSHQ